MGASTSGSEDSDRRGYRKRGREAAIKYEESGHRRHHRAHRERDSSDDHQEYRHQHRHDRDDTKREHDHSRSRPHHHHHHRHPHSSHQREHSAPRHHQQPQDIVRDARSESRSPVGETRPRRSELVLDEGVSGSSRHTRRHAESDSANARQAEGSERKKERGHAADARDARGENEHGHDGDTANNASAAADIAAGAPPASKPDTAPNLGLSGKLAAETNKVNGVVLKFVPPQEASKPSLRWRLYIFKGEQLMGEPLYIHRMTHYLFGRERRVADIPVEHPSCSGQHAVLCFRRMDAAGDLVLLQAEVRPYIMDLESTNGTYLNSERIEPLRYYQLLEKDVIKFGFSSREYVLLHDKSEM